MPSSHSVWDTAVVEVERELHDGLLTVRMNRPQALNAWTPEMGRELLAAVRDASADRGVRAVLLTGAGRAFCAGADLRVPRETLPDGTPDLSSRLREIYNPIMLAVAQAPKPFVAALNGPAAGIGVALALSCDLILAAESAYLLLAFVNIGLVPDGAAAFLLASRAGFARASELALLGRRLPAARAREWGILNEVWPDEEFAARSQEYAARLAAGPTVALANAKLALRAGAQAGLAEALERDAALQQAQASTRDHLEGVAAFREKRPPRFTGS
jgi:2-(1,2-epoxy-1,2-dihydrophenyl)acetyl-CoA isomerase